MKLVPVLAALLLAILTAPQENTPGLLQMAADHGVKQLGKGSETIFVYQFTRAGQRRDALVLTPGTTFETTPMQSTTRRCVSLLAAMPFNLGDGATLTISVKSAGQDRRVIQLDLDPAHIRAHRAWLPIRFDVPSDRGDFTVIFNVNAGSRGDQTGDWVGLSPGSDKSCLFGS